MADKFKFTIEIDARGVDLLAVRATALDKELGQYIQMIVDDEIADEQAEIDHNSMYEDE